MLRTAFIPARRGSKGIPDKNIMDFCGKPLIQWTVDAAVKSGVFEEIVVSTDYKREELSFLNGDASYDFRPKSLCKDRTPLDWVITEFTERHDYDFLCLLQPTSPLRDADDIKRAMDEFLKSKRDSLVSVSPQHQFVWVDNAARTKFLIPIALYNPNNRPNRQQHKDWYRENGAIYITTRHGVLQTRCRINGTVKLFPMPEEKGIEIDSPMDLTIAKAVYESTVQLLE